MNDIAAGAAVTKRTLYQHFDSKDALLAAMLEMQHKLAMAAFVGMIDRSKRDPEQLVETLFADLAAWSAAKEWGGSGFTRLADGLNSRMHLSHDLVGKIQPTFDELIFDGSGEQLDDESIGKSNSLVTTAAELSLITGAFFEEAARCVAYPKPWSVKSKHKVEYNRLRCCAKQPKGSSWVGTGR